MKVTVWTKERGIRPWSDIEKDLNMNPCKEVAITAQPNDSWLDKVIADDSLPPNHAVIDGKLVCYSHDPKVLVEALERIVSYENNLISHSGARHAAVRLAREALAEWKARQPEVVPASSVLVPTIDELAEAMYQNNTALLTNVEARYIAKVVHALLTKGRGGV